MLDLGNLRLVEDRLASRSSQGEHRHRLIRRLRGAQAVDPAIEHPQNPAVTRGISASPESVVEKALFTKFAEPTIRLHRQRVIPQQPPHGQQTSVDLEGLLGQFLRLVAGEVRRASEKILLDGHRWVRVVQELPRLDHRRVVANQGIGDDQVERDFQASRPVPLGGPIPSTIRGRLMGRLEKLGLARLVEVQGIVRVNLGKPEEQDASDPGQGWIRRAKRLLPEPNRRVERSLGQELASLIVSPGSEVGPLLGIALLVGLDRVIGVMMGQAGDDLDGLLRNLLIGRGRDLLIRERGSALLAGDDLGLSDRPGQRVVGLGGIATGTSAVAQSCLDRDKLGQPFRWQFQEGENIGAPPESSFPGVRQVEAGERVVYRGLDGQIPGADAVEAQAEDQGENDQGSFEANHGSGSIPSTSCSDQSTEGQRRIISTGPTCSSSRMASRSRWARARS